LQVTTFLQTISAEPPTISLGGYVRINRELLVAVSTHVLTSAASSTVLTVGTLCTFVYFFIDIPKHDILHSHRRENLKSYRDSNLFTELKSKKKIKALAL
jgi:hypothetical protein